MTKNNIPYDTKDKIPQLYQKIYDSGIIDETLLIVSIIKNFNLENQTNCLI